MEPNDSYLTFLAIWHEYMWYLFLAAIGLSVLTVVAYHIRYASQSNYKTKYDLVSQSETATYLRANYFLAAGIFFLINTVYDETVALSGVWFFIRMFISVCISTLHIYIAYLVFNYYYQGPLNKKLKKLRYSPRINSKTGNKMKLLSEDEEDAYLDEGMQAEENAFSVDYDVWIDPVSGETKIEKYKGHLGALECDRCGFQTLKLEKEQVLQEATDYIDGLIEKEYKCTYCGRIKRKTVNLTKNMNVGSSTSSLLADPLEKLNKKEVEAIILKVLSTDGSEKIYEFQNIDQAKHFLEEFNFEKIGEN